MKTTSPFPDISQKHITGIIGRSLGHTLSPLMHNTAYKELNLNFVYGVFQVAPDMLRPLIESMKQLGIRGANVTIPYKQDIMRYIDHSADDARIVGAVNTIVNDNGIMTGYNTDIDGVRNTLLPFSRELRGGSVVVLGAGGAARAVLHALATSFAPQRIVIINRTAAAAIALAREAGKKYSSVEIVAAIDDEISLRELKQAVLIVNATSVGMSPESDASPLPADVVLRKDQIVFDTVYTPIRTVLLQKAARDGARTLSGIDMLLEQGSKAFTLFTEKNFPLEAARTAVHQALRQELHI
jgi:shikimate dehydrogenase